MVAFSSLLYLLAGSSLWAIASNGHALFRRQEPAFEGWKCVQSPSDGFHSLWVSQSKEGYISCAGPNPQMCYWFSDDKCSKLVTDTQYSGEACCGFDQGWCKVAYESLVAR